MLYVCLSWGSKECLYVFNRIRTSHDAAPYSPCCASHLTCYCTGLLTVWSLWGNPGMARCRKKSALAFGYIQKPKALLASSSGKSSSMGGTSGGATGQVASTLRYFFFLFSIYQPCLESKPSVKEEWFASTHACRRRSTAEWKNVLHYEDKISFVKENVKSSIFLYFLNFLYWTS